jgi:hypothetical protein
MPAPARAPHARTRTCSPCPHPHLLAMPAPRSGCHMECGSTPHVMIDAISPWLNITRRMRVGGTEDTFNFTILVHSTYNHHLTPHIFSNYHHPHPFIPSNHHHPRPFIPPPHMSSRNAQRPPIASSSPDPLQGAAQEMPLPNSRDRDHEGMPEVETRRKRRRVRKIDNDEDDEEDEEDDEDDDDEEEYLPSTVDRVSIIVACAMLVISDAFTAHPPTFTVRFAQRVGPTAPKATEEAAPTPRGRRSR